MISRDPLTVAIVLSLTLHLVLLLWMPRSWVTVIGEEGHEKLVVSFGTIELPAVATRAEASEARPVVEPPKDVEMPVIPMQALKEASAKPDPVEKSQEPVRHPPIKKKPPLAPDVLTFRPPVEGQPSAATAPSDNETPGAPEMTAGAVADARARFLAEVVSRIQKVKRYPAEARRKNVKGTSKVEFALSARGEVLSVRLVSSSGHLLLDGESLDMIRRAGPYPRIPEEIGLARIELVLPVEFELKAGR